MMQAPLRRPFTRRRLLVLVAATTVEVTSAMAAAQESTTAMLRGLAGSRGRLPVLVGLRMPQDGADTDPMAAIARARATLFTDLGIAADASGQLHGPGIVNVKPFATIPFVALTVEPAALELLLRHPLVASVTEDTAVPPS